ncbi:MAG: DUF262 domain-containing protein [Peptostreptococcaceae bacterium]|nr:DUF262 domain-containing protein [Peptostreptococcaceae bacterium]
MSISWYEDIFDNDDEISVNEYDITTTPNDFNILTIFSLIDNGVIKIPPFQRNYVWDEKRASRLIESIILGLPIPQVFLYEQEKNSFFVIDGQQRLLSIYFFIKQRFPTKDGRTILRKFSTGDMKIIETILSNDSYFTKFRLKLPALSNKENNKLDGLTYDTLGEYKDTFQFLRTIRSVVIKQNEPDDDSSMYEIFNRLNTGGQNLKPQEIRMSLYYSEFYKQLIELNDRSDWRSLLKQKEPDVHFKDIEILLRAFAMLLEYEQYRSPMGKFLNTFLKKAKNFDNKTIEYLKKLFLSFLKSCSDVDPDVFYSAQGQFIISLFESVFVASCINAFREKNLICGKLDNIDIRKLKHDNQFIKTNQSGVASKKNVEIRIKRAMELIQLH